MAHFERREFEANTWNPNIACVDFTERLHRFMGEVAMDGSELYTAWFIDDDYEEQITPETSRLHISLVDDESDTVLVLDRRDNLWFQFLRVAVPDLFDSVVELVRPWSTVVMSLTPSEEIYSRYLKLVSKDTSADELHVPEDW
jgi:hypothetical protein